VLRPALPALARSDVARTALLALRGRPWRALADETRALQDGFGSPDRWRLIVWSTLVDVPHRLHPGCPVTLAQGAHDWTATGQTPRHLPLVEGSRRALPFAGHAPMSDVPDRLVALVRETAAAADR
jgi:hypothetical protein